MNAPLNTEILLRPGGGHQAELQLASEGVLRYVWEGRFGFMLIEVRGGQVYVNGGLVEPASGAIAHDHASIVR
jgi:hypothetical protein